MTQGFVQVPPDSTGKKVDNTVVVLPDGTTQYRQAIVIADPVFNNNVGGVTAGGDQQVRNFTLEDLMLQVLIELRVMNTTLVTTLNSRDDVDALRAQESLSMFQQTN